MLLTMIPKLILSLFPSFVGVLHIIQIISSIDYYHNPPITGTVLVGGMVSATNNRNTVNDRSTVIPRLIFSPDSGGRKNVNIATSDRNIVGITRLNR